jgi:hypothetical protein
MATLLDPILRFWRIKFLGVRNLALSSCRIMLLFTVTVRHMYAATAVSDKGQLQGAVTKGCAPSSQTACVYKELRSSLPSLFFSL